MSLVVSRIVETLFLALGAVLLLRVAHGGQAWPPVMAALAFYLVVLTLWVRGQYDDSVTTDPARRRVARWFALFAGAGLLVSGILLLGLWWWLGKDESGLVLAGIVTVLAGMGYLIIALRRAFTGLAGLIVSAGLLLVGLGVVVTVVGWLWHDGHLSPAKGLGLAGALLLLTVGTAGVSEVVMAWLERRVVLGLLALIASGALFTVVVIGVWHWSAGSSVAVIAVISLGVVVVSVVSSTQADGGIIVAVVALMGVTPVQADVPAAATDAVHGSRVLVALGDSYMSGEGASVYYQGTDDADGDQCRRSPTSWAALAGSQRPFKALVFLACSGDTTKNIRCPWEGGASVTPCAAIAHTDFMPAPARRTGETGTQLQEYLALADQLQPSLVVVSIGGNDAGFSTIGEMCIAPGNCDDTQGDWLAGLRQVRQQLVVTYAEIRDVFPNTPVVVTAYPDPINIADSENGCNQVSLSTSERAFLHVFVRQLDKRIASTSDDFGFYYLGAMQGALRNTHLQLCDTENHGHPGLNFVGFRSINGVAQQRFDPANWLHSSLHPNEAGHTAMLHTFETWLQQQRVRQGTWPLAALNPDATTTYHSETDLPGILGPAPAARCDLFSDSPLDGCRPQGNAWAVSHLARAALNPGWIALPLVVLAWIFGVSGFALLRRLHEHGQPPDDGAAPGKQRDRPVVGGHDGEHVAGDDGDHLDDGDGVAMPVDREGVEPTGEPGQ